MKNAKWFAQMSLVVLGAGIALAIGLDVGHALAGLVGL